MDTSSLRRGDTGNGIVDIGMIEELSIGLKGRRIFPAGNSQTL